jgi:hypothetical protein
LLMVLTLLSLFRINFFCLYSWRWSS